LHKPPRLHSACLHARKHRPPPARRALSLHDALPICAKLLHKVGRNVDAVAAYDRAVALTPKAFAPHVGRLEALRALARWDDVLKDRKSTRLNSSHVAISYAVLCLTIKTVRPDILQAL